LYRVLLGVLRPDREGAGRHLFGLVLTFSLPQQGGVVLKALCRIRMLGSEGLFRDRQSTLMQQLGFGAGVLQVTALRCPDENRRQSKLFLKSIASNMGWKRRRARSSQLLSWVMNNSDKVVLVVEDNPINMRLFHALLDAHGYNVLQATNGMDGWQMAQEHQPNVILMDMQLPDIQGVDVIQRLKEDETLKSIPVVAVTAFAMKGDEERFREIGCDGYISKPISVPNFVQTIEHVMAEHGSHPAECKLETA
jgi:two-component system cell cycle response regulator DivK